MAARESKRRMHIYVNEATDKIIRAESKKRGVTISDYVSSTALAFRADDASKKLDVALQKLKGYSNRRRRKNGKRKR